MQKVKLTRGKKRIIGGVCSTLAEEYNFEPWLLRIGLILVLLYTSNIIYIYLIAWLIIPNRVKVDYLKHKKIHILGIFIGAVLGALLFGALTFFAAIFTNDPAKGGIAPLLVAFLAIPFGMVIGFSIVRAKIEKNAFNEH